MKLYVLSIIVFCTSCTYSDTQSNKSSNVVKVQESLALDSVVNEWSDKVADWYDADKSDSAMALNLFMIERLSAFQIKWIEVSSDFRESTLDSLWISEGAFHADIYTYNTVIESDFDSMNVSFGIDSEVYLFNESEDSVAILLHTAGYESTLDARWMTPNVLTILGYATESADEVYPLIWVINLETEELTRLQYVLPTNQRPSRVRYFRNNITNA